jgi:hypothetical protein
MSRALSLAGFQVTLIGRICVTPEGEALAQLFSGQCTRIAEDSGQIRLSCGTTECLTLWKQLIDHIEQKG